MTKDCLNIHESLCSILNKTEFCFNIDYSGLFCKPFYKYLSKSDAVRHIHWKGIKPNIWVVMHISLFERNWKCFFIAPLSLTFGKIYFLKTFVFFQYWALFLYSLHFGPLICCSNFGWPIGPHCTMHRFVFCYIFQVCYNKNYPINNDNYFFCVCGGEGV